MKIEEIKALRDYYRAMDFNHLADIFQEIANDFEKLCKEHQESENQLTELKTELKLIQQKYGEEKNNNEENCTAEHIRGDAGGEDDRSCGDGGRVVEDGICLSEGEQHPAESVLENVD